VNNGHPGRRSAGDSLVRPPADPGGRRFDDRPLLVFWEMTTACGLACRHCRACAQLEPGADELSTDEGRALIDELARVGRPRPILILTGGDCLKRSDIIELVAHAEQGGVPVAVAPSVTPALTDAVLGSLRRHGVKTASLSLDGATAATHDAIRGISGHFDATLAAIGQLHRHGFVVQVNTTVMGPNQDELADMAILIETLGVAIWEVFFLISTGRGVDVQETTAAENEDICEFLTDASCYGFTVRTVEAPFFRRIVAARRGGGRPRGGALYRRLSERLRDGLGEPTAPMRVPSAATRDGKGIIFVASTGDVYPSGFMPLRLGNVRDGGLLELYRQHPLLQSIRAAEFSGPCGRCPHAQLCGGSRARALAATGNPLGSDPGCLVALEGDSRSERPLSVPAVVR